MGGSSGGNQDKFWGMISGKQAGGSDFPPAVPTSSDFRLTVSETIFIVLAGKISA